MRRVELLERDGTYLRDLDVLGWSLSVDRQRSVRRTATITLPEYELTAVRQLGRRLRIYDGERQLFGGYIDAPRTNITPGSVEVTVEARDNTKVLKQARWVDDQTYEDEDATESENLVSAVTASSSLSAGDPIQEYAVVYRTELRATVLGTQRLVEGDEAGSMLDGSYSVDYTEEGLQELELTAYVDLRAQSDVRSVAVDTNGTVTSQQVSTDGMTWVAYGPGVWRYYRFTVTAETGPVTIGLTVVSDASYSPANVLVDDNKSWRPRPFDLERIVTLDLGSSQTCNVVYLRWGVNSRDRVTRYRYDIHGSTDGNTWTLLCEDCAATSGRVVEHCLEPGSRRYLRITVKSATGPVALRHARVQEIVSDTPIHSIIREIAESEGETKFRLTETRQFVKAVTFESGRDKWSCIEELAQSIGWEVFYSADEYLTFRPRDLDVNNDPPTYEAMFSLEAEWSDDELFNEVIVVYESADTVLRQIAQDNNAYSVTGIPRIGRRTAPIQKTSLADTQTKLDALATDLLGQYTQQATRVSFQHTAVPHHEAGDVIRLRHLQTGFEGTFTLEAFDLSENREAGTYDLHARVVQEVL